MKDFINRKVLIASFILVVLIGLSIAYTYSKPSQINYGPINYDKNSSRSNVKITPDKKSYYPGTEIQLSYNTGVESFRGSFLKPLVGQQLILSTPLKGVNIQVNPEEGNAIKSSRREIQGRWKTFYFNLPLKRQNLTVNLLGEIPGKEGSIKILSAVQRNHYLFNMEDFYLNSITKNIELPNIDDCKLEGVFSLCCLKNNKIKDCSNKNKFSKNEFIIAKLDLDHLARRASYDPYQACVVENLKKVQKLNVPEHYNTSKEEFPCTQPLKLKENHTIAVYGAVREDPLINLRIYPAKIQNLEDLDKNRNQSKLVYQFKGEMIE